MKQLALLITALFCFFSAQSKEFIEDKYILYFKDLFKDDYIVYQEGGKTVMGKMTQYIKTDATSIISEYKQNEFRAYKKYKDKIVLIKGIVDGVDLDISNIPVVKLQDNSTDGFSLENVLLYFENSNNDLLLELSKGDEGYFACASKGEIVGSPIFVNCMSSNEFSDIYVENRIQEIKDFTNEFKNLNEKELVNVMVYFLNILEEKGDSYGFSGFVSASYLIATKFTPKEAKLIKCNEKQTCYEMAKKLFYNIAVLKNSSCTKNCGAILDNLLKLEEKPAD